MKHKLKLWSSDPVLGKDSGRGGEGEWDVWMFCSRCWLWPSKWQVVAELCVPTCAPNSLLLKRLKCCESVYGRGQSWTQASLTAPGKPKHDFLDSVLKINLLGPAGSSHLSMTLPVRDFFLASFKIKLARQLPGVQGRSQNAEQT